MLINDVFFTISNQNIYILMIPSIIGVHQGTIFPHSTSSVMQALNSCGHEEFKRFFKNHVCISYIVSINFMLVLLSWLLLQLTVTLVYLFNNWPFMIYILVTVLQKDKEQVKNQSFSIPDSDFFPVSPFCLPWLWSLSPMTTLVSRWDW